LPGAFSHARHKYNHPTHNPSPAFSANGTKGEFAAARQFVRLLRYCRLDLLASRFSALDPKLPENLLANRGSVAGRPHLYSP
jgi:hypothetical protein